MSTMSLQVEARQSLHLSRQTIQSIELLALPSEDLDAFLQEQYERNPLLQVKRGSPSATVATGHHGVRGAAHDFRDAPDLAAFPAARPTLREHLHQQLGASTVSAKLRPLVAYIIDSLEADGYLRLDLEDMSALVGQPRDELEAALSVVQGFDPTGIGARDLAECLRLQLAEQGELDECAKSILDHFQLLASGDLARLARACRMSAESVAERIRRFRSLSLSPGHSFDFEPPCPALPDVVVAFLEDGTIHVEMNPAVLPRVIVDRDYFVEISSRSDHRERRFLKECLQDARQLIRNLDQRTKTILRVAAEIVRRQEDFLRRGSSHLKPLTQQDIAATIGIHESTVSRAVANRYLVCPRGQFGLKDFFTVAIGGGDGDDGVAAEVIRQRIKHLVAAETADHIYSDDALVSALALEGIGIARRTVAKYRAQLRIGSSSERRRTLRFR